MKHRILITNYQKRGRKYGQPIPIRPALRIINNYDSRSAITIPVLPKVRPLFSFFYHARDRYYNFNERRCHAKREQGSARKAVTLLSFRFHSLVSFIHIYPAICRAVRTPPQNSAKAKEVRSGSGCP